jgi:hypothetical protein
MEIEEERKILEGEQEMLIKERERFTASQSLKTKSSDE